MSPNFTSWTSAIQQKMQRDWDARARENAFYYIASSRQDWSPQEFFSSGEESVRELVSNDLEMVCHGVNPSKMRVLEIGCGAGRMTRALAGVFGEVHGVDISGEMVRQARELHRDVPNAFFHQNNGVDLTVLGDLRFDFAFSFIVFQHIPSRAVIENYIREVSRLLRPGAVFKFQVQGSPQAVASEDDTWIGAPISAEDSRRIAGQCGFELLRAEGAGGQYFWLWYLKPTRWQMWRKAVENARWFEGLRLR